MIGNWKGYYKFDNERIQQAMGHDKTNFTIVIESYEDGKFLGKVNDDVTTGGMKETGNIAGAVNKNQIRFKKFMPVNCIILESGERIMRGRKHPTPYYKGILSDDQKEISGKWFFKKKIGFLYGFVPVMYSPGKGTWSMKLS